MLVAVIGDNHGNALGLAEVVKDLRRRSPDVTVHLGDAFQGGTQPSESAEMLRDLGCQIALGNSDNWLATAQSAEAVGGPAGEVGGWTRQQLGEEGLDMIRGFPLTIQVDTPGGKLLCFHGSPTSFDHVLLPEIDEDEVRGYLGGTDAAVLAGGHTHIQWTRTFEGATFVNPGSAGAVYNRYMEMEESSSTPCLNTRCCT